ncbi:MAG: protein kinase, partial [Polyangiaceae bacterium]|nr:protein kinase [Polyangiaceae bacterium]
VLDWLEGETLAQRLAHAVPTMEAALAMVVKVARALGHAHERGVVHRDVKPSNIFLVGSGWDDPRVLDFGVARVLMGTKLMTRSGTALGTPAYMAPEQARGRREVDARADAYALGCLLFECLSGQPPFEGEDVMAVLAKVLFDDPPRLSTKARAVPEALDDLVAHLMQKDPALRPANGDEVADLLLAVAEDAAKHEDVLHLPSSRPPRPLTTREQKLVAVVAATPSGSDAPRGEHAPTLATEAVMTSHDFASEAASFGARFAPLADGSCIAVLEGIGSATDLALRAARCGLALRARRPELPLAIAMGRATAERVPVGEVIDRVALLLRRSGSAGAIRIDELVSGLIDVRFDVTTDARGISLERERDTPLGPRLLLGRPSPCVGRARELRMLGALYEECVSEPAASLAVVTGAAGMGKTRLVSEWLAKLESSETPPAIWLGRGDPIAAGSPHALVGSALRSVLGVGVSDAGERRFKHAWSDTTSGAKRGESPRFSARSSTFRFPPMTASSSEPHEATQP